MLQTDKIKVSIPVAKIMLKNTKIVLFNVVVRMKWDSYFDYVYVDEKKDDEWILKNIKNFVMGKSLTLYIKNCLNVTHWAELIKFNEEFITPGELSLTDLADIKSKTSKELNDYYKKKVTLGRQLGLYTKLVFEGSSGELPMVLRKIVVTNAPKTASDWRNIVYKLHKMKNVQKGPGSTKDLNLTPFLNEYQQWRPGRTYVIYNQIWQPRPRFSYQST